MVCRKTLTYPEKEARLQLTRLQNIMKYHREKYLEADVKSSACRLKIEELANAKKKQRKGITL
jgi:hypothetical protein